MHATHCCRFKHALPVHGVLSLLCRARSYIYFGAALGIIILPLARLSGLGQTQTTPRFQTPHRLTRIVPFAGPRDVPWNGTRFRTPVSYSAQAGHPPRMDQDYERCDARVRGDARGHRTTRYPQVPRAGETKHHSEWRHLCLYRGGEWDQEVDGSILVVCLSNAGQLSGEYDTDQSSGYVVEAESPPS